MRVSPIGTYHPERDPVTVSALLEVLERIQPEVVFAETPRTHIAAWTDGSHGNVESLAVARYAHAHWAEVVPVDLPMPEDSFFRDHDEVTRAMERASPQFRRLMDLNSDRVREEGFSYLNSGECDQAWADIYREELATIEYLRNSRLADIYARVRDLIERRDQEMLRSIAEFCER
ncbi:MAG: hypothetical protein JWM95_2361 [Gemmatimonadetes bacterium]|nr:hypothetical protein [Gemmatimonadota bacterium]